MKSPLLNPVSYTGIASTNTCQLHDMTSRHKAVNKLSLSLSDVTDKDSKDEDLKKKRFC